MTQENENASEPLLISEEKKRIAQEVCDHVYRKDF